MQTNDLILVTGAAGFIGSALVWELNRRGFERIIITDVLGTDEKWRNLVPLRFENYFDASDLLGNLESGALRDVRWIFHLGACSATTEKDASYLMENNFHYTRRLAEWAHLECYRPLNMYGYSKHLFDLHAKRHGWLDRLVGLKYFNIFGPNEDHKGEMRSVVHKAYAQIRDTGSVELFRSHRPEYRDGEQQRDFLYVKDAVNATIHLATHPQAAGIFNIGSGIASTWTDLVTPIFHALDLPVSIQFIDMPEILRGKYQYRTLADTARLKSCGWTGPEFTLDAAVRDYVGHYLVSDRRLGD
jgi:ADP-L-glycero-D-manno-heptose 6-epimerase